MIDRQTASRSAAAQMSDALARWERDGGAVARTASPIRDDKADTRNIVSVLADVAMRQGFILERRSDNDPGLYRLLVRGDASSNIGSPMDFKLTLEDLQTVLMNPDPA